jgi:hypothetical protein
MGEPHLLQNDACILFFAPHELQVNSLRLTVSSFIFVPHLSQNRASVSFFEPQNWQLKKVDSTCRGSKVKLPIIEVLPFSASIFGNQLASCLNCSIFGINFEMHSSLKMANFGFLPDINFTSSISW